MECNQMAYTLRTDEKDEKAIAALKDYTGEAATTKAVMVAVHNYVQINASWRNACDQRDAALEEVRALRRKILAYQSAQAALFGEVL
ncbi:hypothetical protein VXM60_10500 [Shewanella khirikhana]|uniref:hypothetical protein n=1 Tax=Shewanella khirikhana TaxID=1965282 RepID=UPI0030CBC053